MGWAIRGRKMRAALRRPAGRSGACVIRSAADADEIDGLGLFKCQLTSNDLASQFPALVAGIAVVTELMSSAGFCTLECQLKAGHLPSLLAVALPPLILIADHERSFCALGGAAQMSRNLQVLQVEDWPQGLHAHRVRHREREGLKVRLARLPGLVGWPLAAQKGWRLPLFRIEGGLNPRNATMTMGRDAEENRPLSGPGIVSGRLQLRRLVVLGFHLRAFVL